MNERYVVELQLLTSLIMTKVNRFTGFDMLGHQVARTSDSFHLCGGQIVEIAAILIIGVGTVEQMKMIAGHTVIIPGIVSRSVD